MTLLALVTLLPMRHRRTPSLLRLLALLVEARLCGNDVSLDGVLFDSLPVPFATRYTPLSPPLNLLQLEHPIRHFASADLHHVRDRTQHRLSLTLSIHTSPCRLP